MPHADFVHLRARSAYSLSEGAIRPDALAALARDAGMPAVAIADNSNLFGALEFSQYCTGKGVQPIVGCQLGISRTEAGASPDPVVLLAQTEEGLANLQRLSSRAFLESEPGRPPQLAASTVAAHAAGLFLLTGGSPGPLDRLLGEGRQAEAAAMLAGLREAFGPRLAVELHRHGLPAQARIEPALLAVADGAGVPIVATNDVYFARPDMHLAHDALLCIAEARLLADGERRRVTPEHWFKPAAVMRGVFADLPDAVDNTLVIARGCAVMAESRKPLLPVSPKVRPGRRRRRPCAPWPSRAWSAGSP